MVGRTGRLRTEVTRTSALAQRFHVLDNRLLPSFARFLRRFFTGQANRVIARYFALYAVLDLVTLPPHPEELLPDEERSLLWTALVPFLLVALSESANLAGNLVGLPELPDDDPRISTLINEASARVPGMHRTTLGAIRVTLSVGTDRQYTVRQIANGIAKDEYRGLHATVNEVYSGRAERIARTELAYASAIASLERYQDGGVSEVECFDGEGCGWERHNDPDKADRTRRTLWAAQAFPLSHPHCVRKFAPIKAR
jgi:hypothetical protein